MASSDIIREFLVALGYRVDKGQQREFAAAVESSTVKVAALGTALVGAGSAVVAYTNRAAEYGEKLYWLSQRSKASAAGIEALGYAASQLGSSTDAAYGSIEAFGRFLQSAPGAKQWLERWIGPFENADDALIKVGRRFKDSAPYFRNMVAQTLGLDYNFAQSLFSGQFEQRVQEERDRAASAGIDRDKFAQDATQFKQAWREFWNELGLIGDRAASELFTPMRDQLDSMTRFLDAHAAEWGKTIGDFVKSSSESIQKIFGVLGSVATGIDALAHGDIGAVGDAAKDVAKGTGDILSDAFDARPGSLGDKESWKSLDALRGTFRRMLGIDDGKISGDVTPQSAHDFFVSRGWKHEQATGIIANLLSENAQMDPAMSGDNGLAYGIAQWHRDRQATFSRIMRKDIRKSNAMEQLAFIDWELRNTERAAGDRLRMATLPGVAADVVSRFYERPRAVDEAAYNRSQLAESMAPKLNQTNNITINGSSSPAEIGFQIGRETARQAETALRQLAGAVR